MADFVATAFVRIQSELEKGFRANLRTQIEKSLKGGITVPLRPQILPFRAKLQAEARKTPILIPVKPDIAIGKFREELRLKVTQAAKGVFVSVPVGVGTATGRGRGDGGSGATKAKTDAEKQLASQEKILTGLTERHTAATAKLELAERRALGTEFQLRQTKAGLRDIEKGLTIAVREETTARAAGFTELAAEIALRKEALATLGESIALKQADLSGSVKQAALTTAFADAQDRANVALSQNVKAITSRSTLANLNNDLLAVEADLHELNAKALIAEDGAIQADTAALLENITARKGDITAQREQLAAGSKRATQVKTAGRGGIATALSAIGARGATLAAGGEFLAGAAAVAITAKAISGAADLQKQLNILRVVSRATAEEMEQVRVASIELGRDVRLPGVSAGDAAKSMTQLVKAGLSVQDAIDGAKGTLELATAAEIDFADAGNLVASALNAFALRGTDAVHVADLLTNAANESQGEITDMGISLQQAAGAASLVGVNLDDTVTLLTLLSRAGLKGSDAGTSLRTAFIKLINPTKKANAVLDQLNINLRDSLGNIRPEVFAEFEQATSRLTRAEHDRAAAVVFGTDAIRAQSLIGRQGIDGLNRTREALDRNGAAAELAGAQAEGLTGKISALTSNLETFGTLLGSITLGPLSFFVETISEAVSQMNEFFILAGKLGGQARDVGEDASGSVPGLNRFLGAMKEIAKQRIKGAIIPAPVQAAGAGVRGIDRLSGGRILPHAKQDADDVKAVRLQVEALFKTLGQGPLNDRAINEVVVTLDGMARKLSDGDAEAQALARSIREIIAAIQKTGRVPTIVDIKAKVDPAQARVEGATAAEKVLLGFRDSAPGFVDTGLFLLSQLGIGMEKGVDKLVIDIPKKFSSTLGTKLAEAEAHGSDAAQIAVLQQQRANAAKREQSAKINPNLTNAQRNKQVAQAASDFKTADDAIQAILDQQQQDKEQAASDAEQKAKDIADAQEKLDQAVLDAFGLNRQKAQNKITLAGATPGLADDIKATKFYKQLVILQIRRIKEQIKTGELKKKALQEAVQTLFGLTAEIRALTKSKNEALRDQIRTGLELDVDFFQTTENQKGEIRARNKLIANIQKEINQLKKQKKLTIEQKNHIKELRNEIAEQRAALKELKGEQDKTSKLGFEFLQAQSGFAANLLGNLIPMGATAGIVGGVTAPVVPRGQGGGMAAFPALPGEGRQGPGNPGEAVRKNAGVQASGPSKGGQNTQTQLLRQMLRVLHDIYRGTGHPEAKHRRRTYLTGMDLSNNI